MTASKNNVCKIPITFMLLYMTCCFSFAQNDFIVKLLSNQMEFLLRQQDVFVNDIEQLTEKLEEEIATRKTLTETVLWTESLVITQQREIGKIKAHLLREHDRNRYLLHNNTLLATELKRLRKGITAEKNERYILTSALADVKEHVKQLTNANGNSSCVNCCQCYPDSNHIDSTNTTGINKNRSKSAEKANERVIKPRGVTYSGDPINSEDKREARDCDAISKLKYNKNGVYRIALSTEESVNVYCNLRESTRNWNLGAQFAHLRGWLGIQRRMNGTLNFNRSWTDYQKGFGDLDGEYWLGNDVLFRLINSSQSRVLVFIRYYAQSYSYYYRFFMRDAKMNNATQGYQLLYLGSSYTTVIGNMGPKSKSYFATNDNTSFHDARCPPVNGGWWYTTFPRCNLRDQNPNSRYTTLTTDDGEQYLGLIAPKGDINITGSEVLMHVVRSSEQ